jgi:hypothetical protein
MFVACYVWGEGERLFRKLNSVVLVMCFDELFAVADKLYFCLLSMVIVAKCLKLSYL